MVEGRGEIAGGPLQPGEDGVVARAFGNLLGGLRLVGRSAIGLVQAQELNNRKIIPVNVDIRQR